ncbi:MAG: hypothetical protein ABSH06_23235 [Thermodesulfobacteriota bacterium]
MRPFKLGITDPHPEFGFIGKRAFGELCEQPLETPESLFRFTLRKKNFSLSKEEGIFRLGLG